MQFEEVDAKTVKLHALKMAENLWELDLFPKIAYSVIRGGSTVANSVMEYFDYWRKRFNSKAQEVAVGVIRAKSYHDTERGKLELPLIYPDPREVKGEGIYLICDDVVDSGNTMRKIFKEFSSQFGLERELGKPLRLRSLFFLANDLKLTDDVKTLEDLPDFAYTCWDARTKEDEIKKRARQLSCEIRQGAPLIRYDHELFGLSPLELEERYGLKNRDQD